MNRLEKLKQYPEKEDHDEVYMKNVLQLDDATISKRLVHNSLSTFSLLNHEDFSPNEMIRGLGIICKAIETEKRLFTSNVLNSLVKAKLSFLKTILKLVKIKDLNKNYANGGKISDVIICILNRLEIVFPRTAVELYLKIFPEIDKLLKQCPTTVKGERYYQYLEQWKEEKEHFCDSFTKSSSISPQHFPTRNLSRNTVPDRSLTIRNHLFNSPTVNRLPMNLTARNHTWSHLPKNNFRFLSKIPKREELLSVSKTILHPCIIDGAYNDIEQYLDVQFRLLREDLFHDFRQCLVEYRVGNIRSGFLYSNAHLEEVVWGRSDMLWKFSVWLSHEIDWESTKRLTSGSLVCISSDGFQNFDFAVIEYRYPEIGVGDVCMLHLAFDHDSRKMKIDLNPYIPYDIIETESFYEGNRYVLDNLQNMSISASFPLGNCLIDYKHCIDVPGFQRAVQRVRQFEVHDSPDVLMKNILTEIGNSQQCAAFQMALNNKVALIQGPPGTGKSYLGVQLVRYLIADARVKKPLIIICYTNHALDQFLEKLLSTTKKVIRIGGRSKSEELEPYNLDNLRNSISTANAWHRRGNPYPQQRPYEEMFHYNEGFENFLISRGKFQSPSEFFEALNIAITICGGIISFGDGALYKDLKTNEKLLEWSLKISNAASQRLVNAVKNNHTTEKSKGSKKLSTFLSEIKDDENEIHRWLCISPGYSDVYLEMSEFRKHLSADILVRMKSCKSSEVSEGEKPNKHLKDLLKKLCDYNISSIVWKEMWKQNISYNKSTYNHKLSYLVDNLPNYKMITFFIRSAVCCCKENNIIIDKQTSNLWQYSVLQRWKFLVDEICSSFVTRLLDNSIQNSNTKGNIRSLTHECKNLNEQVRSARDDSSQHILSHADVVGLTTSGCTKHWKMIEKLKPTTFIVEEAAEVLESHIVMSLSTSTNHLILIGDHEQLKPLPKVHDLAKNYNFDVSLFERLFRNEAPSECLNVQYRMRPCISRLLVPEFYSELKNDPSVEKYENVRGMCSNLFFVQHSVLEDNSKDIRSHSNRHEAMFIVYLCAFLISQGNDPVSITILTTYVRQLRLLRKLLSQRSINVQAKTVDNFQGEENDIILLSFVRSNRNNQLGFIKTSNRICVALSRAKRGMYCIGNFEMFARQSTVWKSLVEKLKVMKCFGENLLIYCNNHPTNVRSVSNSEGLDAFLKSGCQIICGVAMSCGDNCSLPCHNYGVHRCNIGEHSLRKQKKEPKHDNPIEEIKYPTSEDKNQQEENADEERHQDFQEHQDSEWDEFLKGGTYVSIFQSEGIDTSDREQSICEERNNSQNLPQNKTVTSSTTNVHNSQQKPHTESENSVTLLCAHKIPKSHYKPGYKCTEIITFISPCGHIVTSKCGYKSQVQCNELISKTLPCGHKITSTCVKITSNAKLSCTEKSSYKFPCGHVSEVPCSKFRNRRGLVCEVPCNTTLKCGHKCPGNCSKCKTSHVPCEVKTVSEQCNHRCYVLCGQKPRCMQRCEFRCEHQRCFNPCSMPCVPCLQQCSWACEHLRCTRTCGASCNRPPCDMRCGIIFDCGHQCAGFCGEPCPQKCPKCIGLKNDFGLVLLEDCGHLISEPALVKSLEKSINSFPKCPECSKPITRNRRFGNLIKMHLKAKHSANRTNA